MRKTTILLILLVSCFYSHAFIVRNIISEAETAIKSALGNAAPLGNYLVDRSANELNLLVQNAEIVLRKDLDKDISKLDNAKQLFINKIQELTAQIQAGKSDFISLADNLYLDVNSIIGSSILAPDKLVFKRVSHISFLQSFENSYFLDLTASNIGFDDTRTSVVINSVELGGKTMKLFKKIPQSDHEAIFKFDKDEVGKFFEDKKLSVVKLTLDLEYKIRKRFKTSHFSLNPSFYIFFFPKVAGDIRVTYKVPVMKWMASSDQTLLLTTADQSCSSDCGDHANTVPIIPMEITVASSKNNPPTVGDKKIVKVEAKCVHGLCPWAAVVMQPVLLDDSTRAYCTVKNWASGVTFRLNGTVMEYDVVGDVDKALSFKGKSYNEIVRLRLPDNVISGEIYYKFSSNEEEKILLGSETQRLKLLDIVEPKGFDYKEYVYQILRPDKD